MPLNDDKTRQPMPGRAPILIAGALLLATSRATALARRMVTQFGMGQDLGPISLEADERGGVAGGSYLLPRQYSEETARHIDVEVKRIVDERLKRAESLLRQHKAALIVLSKELLEKEVIDLPPKKWTPS